MSEGISTMLSYDADKTIFDPNDEAFIFYWWAVVSVISVFNIIIFINTFQISYNKQSGSSTRSYEMKMLYLAVPYVFMCAWRSFWPNEYHKRTVLWDVWMSTPFLARALATLGEITYAF
jgi:hypothetical protein